MSTLSTTFTWQDFLLMLQGAGITFFLTIVSGSLRHHHRLLRRLGQVSGQ